MKKLTALTLCLLLLLCAIPARAAGGPIYRMILQQAGDDLAHPSAVDFAAMDEDFSVHPRKGMTLMVYLCGSDLEDQGNASRDIAEMLASGFDRTELNVLILAGGALTWQDESIPDRSSGIYELAGDVLRPLTQQRSACNMGDPATLSGFINYACAAFPADAYALILWDHGGGSMNGLCHDALFNNDALSMPELRRALKNSQAARTKLRWIGFDACLMATVEVASLVAPYASYMFASEETEPGAGWDYAFLRGLTAAEHPADTGQRLISDYFAFYDAAPAARGSTNLTLSCIDLSRIAGVSDATTRFFRALPITGDTFPDYSRLRREVVSFGRADAGTRDYDLIDLGSAARHLASPGAAEALLQAIGDCVVHARSLSGDCCGLSAYYPFRNKSRAAGFAALYPALGFSEGYTEHICAFCAELMGDPAAAWAQADTRQEEMDRDMRSVFSLIMTPEQLAAFGEAHLIALQAASGQPEAWHLVATQDAHLNQTASTLTGSYVHTHLFVTGSDRQPLHALPLMYTEMDGGTYVVQVILRDASGQRTDAQLHLRRDALTGLATVESVWRYDAAIRNYSPRLTADLADYAAVIHQVTDRTPTHDGTGALRPFPEWDVAAVTECEWPLDAPWQLAFLEEQLDPTSLHIAFHITDVWNEVHMSTPLPLENQLARGTAYSATYDDDLVLIDDVSFVDAGDGASLRLIAALTNRSDAEVILCVQSAMINGQHADVYGEVYGTGPFGGLLPGESQPLMIRLPMDGHDALETLEFVLALVRADDDSEIALIPVTIR